MHVTSSCKNEMLMLIYDDMQDSIFIIEIAKKTSIGH